ncbi:8156_t:CDS:2, partial [Funneliformis geosporum]
MQSRLIALEKLRRNIKNATDRFSNGNEQPVKRKSETISSEDVDRRASDRIKK